MALLTLAQQNLIKPISQNWALSTKEISGTTNFTQIESEVENLELRKLLGNALLYDLQTNPLTALNVLLLDGTIFENCNNDTVEFQGIRFQLANMVYAEYMLESKIQDSYTGMVKKSRPESVELSQGELNNYKKRYQEIALSDFQIMKEYLNENDTLYPLWECSRTKRPYTPRLITVRKTVL